ncbi:MAG: FlgD immunoglobulin-like domain containing protein, partial [Candidatus Krumholzibacteria bacterium]|nr:FlgD immunoglobulin-like domain containing protein [Candidatus Krumholzibacteria bacterium]
TSCTISEGTEYSDKSNDANLFVEFLKNSEHKVGLWVLGDEVAYDLDGSTSAIALELMSTICGVALNNTSYYELTGGREAGGVVTPLITGVTGTLFAGMQYYAFAGCPIINQFDVIETTGPGAYCLQYPDFNSLQYYAGIYTNQTNNFDYAMRTVWIGHSFMYVRDAGTGTLIRNRMVDAVYKFFENPVNTDITGDETPMAFGLAQNFPNPFNPSTRISFTLPVKSHVSLRIYNVAGQLVKTLADGAMDAGSHELTWDGTNNLGSSVASGVYFYKINAGNDYENMKKMVLLR